VTALHLVGELLAHSGEIAICSYSNLSLVIVLVSKNNVFFSSDRALSLLDQSSEGMELCLKILVLLFLCECLLCVVIPFPLQSFNLGEKLIVASTGVGTGSTHRHAWIRMCSLKSSHSRRTAPLSL
jgi:hypothetical protein